MYTGEARLAVRGNGFGPHVSVDVHGRLSRRNVRHHHSGADAVRYARSARDRPLKLSDDYTDRDNGTNSLLLLLLRLLLMQTILLFWLLCSFKQSLSASAVVIRIRQSRNQKHIWRRGAFFRPFRLFPSVPFLFSSFPFPFLSPTSKWPLKSSWGIWAKDVTPTTFAVTRRTFPWL